jgi:hypothetical protein
MNKRTAVLLRKSSNGRNHHRHLKRNWNRTPWRFRNMVRRMLTGVQSVESKVAKLIEPKPTEVES